MQAKQFEIDVLHMDSANTPVPSDFVDLWNMVRDFGFDHNHEYYVRCLERQANQELEIILAHDNGCYMGYCILNFQPKYALFKKFEIPEIQDLNVLPQHRNQGIGRQIITFCEKRSRTLGYAELGIGVGLNSSFGAAQRLYVKMGYIPDGTGISYDRKQVAAGAFKPVDDQLCLMMSKALI